VSPKPPGSSPSVPTCPRCGKPIRPGTGTTLPSGAPVHVPCLASETETIERPDESTAPAQDEAGRRVRFSAATRQGCPVCHHPLSAGGSVLFQGDRLVHALCWRPEPPPVTPDAS
jgi:hypothetical protein